VNGCKTGVNTGYRIQNTARRSSRLAVFCILYSVFPAVADTGEVVRLKLRAQTVVYADVATLGDVLEFGDGSEQLAEQIASQPVVTDPHARGLATVSHDQVVKRLDELGVNLSRVLISGALQCQVTRQTNTPSSPAGQETVPLAGASATSATGGRRYTGTPPPESPGGPRTLATVLRAQADTELAPLGGTAEISFERAGQEFLQLTTPPWEFHISSSDRDKVGLREFHVLVRRDGQVQRKASVTAQVHLVRPVVIARRPLNPGNFVRNDDVALETRVFEQSAGLGPTHVEEVVGQQIKRFVPEGAAVLADAIKAVDLVVRSRPVTVTGDNAGIQVRLTGVALDSGGYGDTVRVRLGDSRRERKMLRGVVTGLGAVRLAEGGSP